MSIRVTSIELKQPNFKRFTTSPGHPIYKHTFRLTKKVQSGAKRRVNVRKGRLRSSITGYVLARAQGPLGRVETHVFYAWYIMKGTGIYGPKHAPIRPKRAKFLVFKPKGSRKFVFAKQVKGIKPNPFLEDALQDIKS